MFASPRIRLALRPRLPHFRLRPDHNDRDGRARETVFGDGAHTGGPDDGGAPGLESGFLAAGADDDRVGTVERDETVEGVCDFTRDELDDDVDL